VPRPVPSLLVALVLLGAGCGAERVSPPDASRPFFTGQLETKAFPRAGIFFEAPRDWPFAPQADPLVGATSSGSATVAIWRYPRTEPLPADDQALQAADEQLQTAIRTRDPEFQLEGSRTVRIDGARAIEVVGTGRVAGQVRRLRSTHVYAKGAEVVVDAYAAPRDFELIDQAVFRPLLRSLRIDPPAEG
jgi:hypothetical protein